MYSKTEGQYGQVTEIRTDSSGNYYISWGGDLGQPHILVFNESVLDLSGDKVGPIPVEDYSNANEILKRIATLNTNPNFHWETPEYRSIALELGCNPDTGRPVYKKEHYILGHKLSEIACDYSGITIDKDRFFALSLITLLRTDTTEDDFAEYINCLEHKKRAL